jgi:hypothetical protein
LTTFRFVRRVDITVENAAAVEQWLVEHGLTMLGLLQAINEQASTGDLEPFYVYDGEYGLSYDTGEYEESDPVYGPIDYSFQTVDEFIDHNAATTG